MLKVRQIFLTLFLSFNCYLSGISQQTTAWDFTMNDCNGNMHHLFSELDSGNVVIIEFFMLSCSPCIDAGNELDPMFQNLLATCSPKIKFYHFGYTNSYTCSQITNWVTTNSFSSVPFDSGAVQAAYYGGMGMPTLAVVAGNTHKVLHTTVGYTAGDTAIIADSIRTFFGCATSSIPEISWANTVSVYPNPSQGKFTVSGMAFPIDLKIYNLLGEKVLETTVNNSRETFSIDEGSGIYFLRGEIEGKMFARKIIVK